MRYHDRPRVSECVERKFVTLFSVKIESSISAMEASSHNGY